MLMYLQRRNATEEACGVWMAIGTSDRSNDEQWVWLKERREKWTRC